VRIWDWPESLDALVAASDHHSLVFETDDVRVLETRIGPGRRSGASPSPRHSFENVSEDEIRVVNVQLKRR
jgi:hypothetical protein